MAQAVADANTGVLAVGLAGNESSNVGWRRYRYDATISITFNRAPNGPAAVSLTGAVTSPSCVTGASRPYSRSTSLKLSATLSDPDVDAVQANMDVYQSSVPSGGGYLSHTRPAAQASGTAQTVVIPSTGLGDGGTYRVQLNAVDTAGRGGSSVSCEFTVDTQPPPVVPGVAPVSGLDAVYLEGATAGAIGVVGAFTFSNGGVADVASYRYGFDDSAMLSTSALIGQITYAPTEAGPHTLYVQSVDRAGWVSPRRDYTFTVGVAPVAAQWRFDEDATATNAPDAWGTGPALTLSSPSLHAPGMAAEVDPDSASASDHALHFGSTADQAVSAGPVVATDHSFSVGAFVKLDDLNGVQTAVSQNGANASAFELGYRPASDPACSDGCWALTLAGADTSSGSPATVVASSRAVAAGQWVYLMGTYDAATNTAQLCVCDPGTIPDSPAAAPGTAAWLATGELAVGRSKATAAAAHGLHGSVDDMTVLTGIATFPQVFSYCQGG